MSTKITRKIQLGLAALSLPFALVAQANTASLNAVNVGWYSNDGSHDEFNDNYSLGGGKDGMTRRNYFVFDLDGISGAISSATLRIYNPNTPASPGSLFGYTSSDPTEFYSLHDVTTLIPTLNSTYGPGSAIGLGIYTDLGSGVDFGGYTASLADNGTYVEISLNAAALSALNGASGKFAIGGSITTLDNLVNPESLFVSGFLHLGGPNSVQLIVTSVPEPHNSALLLAGLGLIGFAIQKRKANSPI